MPSKTAPFDIAKYLDDPETIAAFLTDVLETENPAYINRALGDVARAKDMTEIAQEMGLRQVRLTEAEAKERLK